MKYHVMMRKKYFYRALLLITSLQIIFFCMRADAEERLPELRKGMTNLEVVKLWGSPLEKIEKESKRRDLWVYKSSKLYFDSGVLVAVEDNTGNKTILSAESTAQAAKQTPQTAVTPIANQDVVDDILSEIMKDPSNAEPADNKPGSPPISPVQPNVINQVPPPQVIQ